MITDSYIEVCFLGAQTPLPFGPPEGYPGTAQPRPTSGKDVAQIVQKFFINRFINIDLNAGSPAKVVQSWMDNLSLEGPVSANFYECGVTPAIIYKSGSSDTVVLLAFDVRTWEIESAHFYSRITADQTESDQHQQVVQDEVCAAIDAAYWRKES